MKFRMDQLLFSISQGFDSVEGEILGATTNHGRRVAYLCIRMGQHLGYTKEELITVAACAILHDNALTELYRAMDLGRDVDLNMKLHCMRGENNAVHLPFPAKGRDIIRYHHEFMDHSGPYQLNPERTPLSSQLVAIADDVDVRHPLDGISREQHAAVRAEIEEHSGIYYTRQAAQTLLAVLDWECIGQLHDDEIAVHLDREFPRWVTEGPASHFFGIAGIVAGIVDNKSSFTAKHSVQIANRAYWMAKYYGMDEETCGEFYIAAALHDIGKMMTPRAILEKRGRLTDEEFIVIKEHAAWSYRMLKGIDGLEEVCRWAVTHHRKLNGSGYPDLPYELWQDCFQCRLLACIDIYQAVRERRPYHEGRSHAQTMEIMYQMAENGEIDAKIVHDMDQEMGRFRSADGDVPKPSVQEQWRSWA